MTKIKIDLDLSDKLENIKADSQKADFVLGRIQAEFTGWLTNKDSLKFWNDNRDTICEFIDIVSDYVAETVKGVSELLESTTISKHGGGGA